MRTIAITIDEPTLVAIDRLVRKGGKSTPKSRSAVVRAALTAYLRDRRRLDQERVERQALARHAAKLGRELEALVAEQAES